MASTSPLRLHLWFWGSLLILLTALVIGFLIQRDAEALDRLSASQDDKARMMASTIVHTIMGVARYGPDRAERLEAVLEEVVQTPEILGVALFNRDEGTLFHLGREFPPFKIPATTTLHTADQHLIVIEPFVLIQGHRGGQRCGNNCEQKSNLHALLLMLDQSAAMQTRDHIRSETLVAIGAMLAFLFATLWLLRLMQRNAILARQVALESQQKQNLKHLSLLAAGLAHEIKNPLGAIRGYTQLLNEAANTDETREQTAIMLTELDRLSERLEEFFTFVRPRRDQSAPQNLASIAQQVASLLASDTTLAHIDLQLDCATPFTLHGDLSRLKELVMNLLLNAIQACKDGDHILLQSSEHALTITDSGTGMSEEQLRNIFTPYYTTKPHGIGLGLAIAQQIADEHHLRLAVTSSVGKGTCVKILQTEMT